MASTQEGALTRHTTFENIMHKKTAQKNEGFSAMLKKDKDAQRAAVAEYFQHWDNKEAKTETEADRFVSLYIKFFVNSMYHNPDIHILTLNYPR